MAVLLWTVLQARQKYFDPYSTPAYIADFLLNCCGILFAMTIYADNQITLIGLLTLPAIAMYINQPAAPEKVPDKPPKDDAEEPDAIPVKPFITSYRGAMMIITCICILAVDFPVFPRRFAKTESLGTSLMDLGVGSFVFSAGVISVRGQLKAAEDPSLRLTFVQRMTRALRHALPLLALGFVRLYTVKGLDYAEHVTEYGVHWNFFFTLAAIPPFVAIFEDVFKFVPSYAIIGYAISLTQQLLYTYSDLFVWAVTAQRTDWVSSNKEGLVSLPGYIAIFMAGQGLGMSILSRDTNPLAPQSDQDIWIASMLGGDEKVKELQEKTRNFTIINLAKWSAIWCTVCFFTTGFYGPRIPVSRRFGNMAYFTWVAAFNTVQLLIFCVIEQLFFGHIYMAKDKASEESYVRQATSRVLHAFNRNGLAIFLIANVLTGVINMSVKTVQMADVSAMTILVSYIGALTAIALGLDHYNISIKL